MYGLVRLLLNDQKVKLWEPPYYNKADSSLFK